MRRAILAASILLACALVLSGCASTGSLQGEERSFGGPAPGEVLRQAGLDQTLEEAILRLDPENVTERDIRETLSWAPAPRILNIHGGIFPVHLLMKNFSRFLIGMGYPAERLRNPRDESYSFSCYMRSEKLAGYAAWFYEREGMRPMMIGHSQGGIQTVKVLHELAGTFSDRLSVWNPHTGESEERHTIIDPLTGKERPVVGLELSYASAVGSGGLTRLLPNQWSMMQRLRKIPDSVVEFTGFSMGFDLLGGDFMGFGGANKYYANGKAVVRNVRLPHEYNHVMVPQTNHLAKEKEARDWINAYRPAESPAHPETLTVQTDNILWAADVWHSIKKHWVLELQRLIMSKRNQQVR